MQSFEWSSMSPTRKRYFIRLIGRCLILLGCAAMCVWAPQQFDILYGWRFFESFSILHLLWLLWVLDMLEQLFPIRQHVPIGSQKLFRQHFRPLGQKINKQALKQYIVSTSKASYGVLILWTALISMIGVLYFHKILNRTALFMITAAFYVCDLICVLIWCPFRLLMRTRCCTTCRIFNWDHLMMFTPMLFVDSFFSWSLLGMSIVVWILWECCVLLFPERFWEQTNAALQCSQCTDKLCTQYCRKLRN